MAQHAKITAPKQQVILISLSNHSTPHYCNALMQTMTQILMSARGKKKRKKKLNLINAITFWRKDSCPWIIPSRLRKWERSLHEYTLKAAVPFRYSTAACEQDDEQSFVVWKTPLRALRVPFLRENKRFFSRAFRAGYSARCSVIQSWWMGIRD